MPAIDLWPIVKAHVTKKDVEERRATWQDKRGNDLVDMLAKKGAGNCRVDRG